MAKHLAEKPTPSFILGKAQTMMLPTGGTWSRFRMTSNWMRSTSRIYCTPG